MGVKIVAQPQGFKDLADARSTKVVSTPVFLAIGAGVAPTHVDIPARDSRARCSTR